MEIRPLDASDPDALAAWHAAHNEAHRFGLRARVPVDAGGDACRLPEQPVGDRDLPFGGYVDGRVVTTGLLSCRCWTT